MDMDMDMDMTMDSESTNRTVQRSSYSRAGEKKKTPTRQGTTRTKKRAAIAIGSYL
jgi:hypothetical protein